ncbi:MAG: phosphocholine cytidylyltransferase family protein [Candidatus Neomarinimicrobiota bacterium]
MKAVILVAGISRRLFPSTLDVPKCLLKVGRATIMEHQLRTLRQVGMTDIVMLVGYRREQIMETVHEQFPDLNITFIVNHHFFDTNTAYSLWLTGEHIRGADFFYLNGDVLFPAALLERVLEAPPGNALAVEVKVCGDEEVKVTTNGNRIVDIGKGIAPADALGEFIGIARFSGKFSDPFFRELDEIVAAGMNTAYFEYALKRLAPREALQIVDVTDLPCIEIDFPEDLEKARELWG